ncbi:MAG: peptidoglycan DD-metalloendopeptidase family protein [Treponema sp.]|nr:peptidoglycan DD-metalloendopeptidase family protein [Treponema sp.]
MAVIIEKQRVAKRRRTSTFRSTNKSADFNSGFMSQFRQKPAHLRKKKSVSLFASFAQFSKKTAERRKPHSVAAKKPRKASGSGFSFNFYPLRTLAVIAGTVIIALAALNWEDFDIKTPEILAFQPKTDTETAEQRIIQYAATGIPSIFEEIKENTEPSAPEISALMGNSATNTVNDDPHGSLIDFEWQQYRVQKGDSVSTIAQKFGVSVGAIIASNDIRNARRLQEGAVLRIPNIDGIPYQVKGGDNLSRISASFNVPLEVILDVNDIKSDNIRAGETIFIPGARMNDIDLRLSLGELFMHPLHGNHHITSGYGIRRDPKNGALQFHAGLDFRANTGTTVMAALDGVVSVVSENWLYGKYIIISHSNGYKTLYGHLSAYSVRQGDRVARGRKIGEVGNTGYSTGPHLHFGIYDRNNKTVNPLELLN